MSADNKDKVTILTLRKHKQTGQKTVLVSCYTSWQSKLVEAAGIDAIVVGDSAAMCEHGHKTTLPITLEEMLSHTRAVVRGCSRPFIIGDLPYGTFSSPYDAVKNCEKFMVAGCDSVKLEGFCPEQVVAVTKAGILNIGHLGLTPQTRAKFGGYKIQARTAKEADKLLEQALKLEDSGISALLLEAVPPEVGKIITEKLHCPTWGIGAGSYCSGNLAILHDLLTLFFDFRSKFTKRYLDGSKLITDALKQYAQEVRNEIFPSEEYSYQMKESELDELLGNAQWKYKKYHGDCPKVEWAAPGC